MRVISTMQVLPSQLRASDLVDGYSFNTELVINDIPQSVTVAGSGTTATFVGAKSSAPISGDFVTACSVSVGPLDSLFKNPSSMPDSSVHRPRPRGDECPSQRKAASYGASSPWRDQASYVMLQASYVMLQCDVRLPQRILWEDQQRHM